MSAAREFHFQEGFAGEAVSIAVDGVERARFDARTRLQTGLARIETLDLEPGRSVVIAIPALSLRQEIVVAPEDRWVTVNLVDRKLVVRRAKGGPGYV